MSGKADLLGRFRELHSTGTCGWLILVDPDKANESHVEKLGALQCTAFLVGGSHLGPGRVDQTITWLRRYSSLPVFLFPGHSIQVHPTADGILLPSLISGRNAEFLIGHHVHASPMIHQSGMEVISAGYILTGGEKITGTQYMTQSIPIPGDQQGILCATALAGEQLGMRTIYLEGGSGALFPIDPANVRAVRSKITIPLIVGGGIRTPEQCRMLRAAGATLIVTGNILEEQLNMAKAFENAILNP